MDEVMISSEFDLKSRRECIEFLESLITGLLDEINSINHVIEWMQIEDQECEKIRLELEVRELKLSLRVVDLVTLPPI